jgi:hypothetical protein
VSKQNRPERDQVVAEEKMATRAWPGRRNGSNGCTSKLNVLSITLLLLQLILWPTPITSFSLPSKSRLQSSLISFHWFFFHIYF